MAAIDYVAWLDAGAGAKKAYVDKVALWKVKQTAWAIANAGLDIEKAYTAKLKGFLDAELVKRDAEWVKYDFKGSTPPSSGTLKVYNDAVAATKLKKDAWDITQKATDADKATVVSTLKTLDDQKLEEIDQKAIQVLADAELVSAKSAY